LADSPLTAAGGGLRVAIRVLPRGRADRLIGLVAAGGARRVLKATVTAPAEGGRANAAVLGLLARSWQLPQRDLSIVQGAKSRIKVVRIAGDPRLLIPKITAGIARSPEV
jgi:uncharacterized protein (TIGR00251 family)